MTTVNAHSKKQPSIKNSNNSTISSTSQEHQTILRSKYQEASELSSKNGYNNPPEVLSSKRPVPITTGANLRAWAGPVKNLSQDGDSNKKISNSGQTLIQNASDSSRLGPLNGAAASHHFGLNPIDDVHLKKTNHIHALSTRDIDGHSRDEPKSYVQLWKEGRESHSTSKLRNDIHSASFDQGLIVANTYSRQHQNKKIKNTLAAHIIQKWFREHHDRKINQHKHRSQGVNKEKWVGLGYNKANLFQKEEVSVHRAQSPKKKANKNNNSKQYVYEELETEGGSLPIRDEVTQMKELEEVYKQMHLTGLDGITNTSFENRSFGAAKKGSHHSGETKPILIRDGHKKAEHYLQSEVSLIGTLNNKREKATSPTKMSPTRGMTDIGKWSLQTCESWEKSLRKQTHCYKEYERAVIRIQKAVRKYIFGHRASTKQLSKRHLRNRSNISDSLERSQSSVEQEDTIERESPVKNGRSIEQNSPSRLILQASQELQRIEKENIGLRSEKEKIMKELLGAEEKIEKIVEERLTVERANFKEMMEEYSQFIGKLLQEKIEATQYYEMLAEINKELKAQIENTQTVNIQSELELKVMTIDRENRTLKEDLAKALEEVETVKKLLDSEDYQTVIKDLKEENDELRLKLNDMEAQLDQITAKALKYDEITDMNNMLMDKAKTADSYIKSLEEELFSMRDRIKDEQNEDYIDVHVDRDGNMDNYEIDWDYAEQGNIYPNIEQNAGSQRTQKLRGAGLKREQGQNTTSDNFIKIVDSEEEDPNIDLARGSPTTYTKQQTMNNRPNGYIEKDVILEETEDREDEESGHDDDDENNNATENLADFSFEAKGTKNTSGSEPVENSEVEVPQSIGQLSNGGAGSTTEEDIIKVGDEYHHHKPQKNWDFEDSKKDLFEIRKHSKEYVSGNFAQYEEYSSGHTNPVDEEQNQEINFLIENISKKLESKLNMGDRGIEKEDEEEDLGEDQQVSESRITRTVSSSNIGLQQQQANEFMPLNRDRSKSAVGSRPRISAFTEEEEEDDIQFKKQPQEEVNAEEKDSKTIKKGSRR